MQPTSPTRNKVEQTLEEALDILRQLFRTYWKLLVKPMSFFQQKDQMTLNPVVFTFLSCFLFSIFIGHLSFFIPGAEGDGDIWYFIAHPINVLQEIERKIADFSVITTLLQSFIYFGLIVISSRLFSFLFKFTTEKDFVYRFTMYYSSWQLCNVFLVLVLMSAYLILFPVTIARPDFFILRIVAIIQQLFIVALILFILFCRPIFAVIGIRRSNPAKKYYFRMTAVAAGSFLPLLLGGGIAGYWAHLQSAAAPDKSSYYYYLQSESGFSVVPYNDDSVKMKARLVIVNADSQKVFIDPLHVAEINVSHLSFNDSLDTKAQDAMSPYHFKSDQETSDGDFITIDANSRRIIYMSMAIARKDWATWMHYTKDSAGVIGRLTLLTEIPDRQKQREGWHGLISNGKGDTIRLRELQITDSSIMTGRQP